MTAVTRRGRAAAALSVVAVLTVLAFWGWHAASSSKATTGAAQRPPHATAAPLLSTAVEPSSTPPSNTPPVGTPPAKTSPASTPAPSPSASRTSTSSTAAPPKAIASGDRESAIKQLDLRLTELFGQPGSYSAAVLDLDTGRSTELGSSDSMTEASVIKIDFLETLLYQHQQSGQPLSSADEDNAEAMIEHSDNAAADRIWRSVGQNAGVQAYNSAAGLRSTVMDPTGYWGLSTTSAADQILLLRQLVSGPILNVASRGYALQLLNDVESDQRWGVSAAADPGAATANKNGWLNIDSDGGLWAVNSVGITKVGGDRVLLALLSQHQPDFQTGVNRLQQAAPAVAAIR
jgi:beta-lactamase class A